MKHKITNRPPDAFTLIEMLVVISIIGVLAALLFPVAGSIRKNATIKRAKTELSQLETGIENYKLKLGFYPPDNPGKPVSNQLYFELLGAVENTVTGYETLDGSGQIPKPQVSTAFGRDAFSNLGARKGAEEGVLAENFLKATLKPSQIGLLYTDSTLSGIKVFIGPVPWPDNLPPLMSPASPVGLNPWRYVSSNPTNNTKSYDLWIDLVISGKIHRISNWRKEPEIF